VGQNVSELDDRLTIVANNLAEELRLSVSSHSHLRRENQTKQGIDHRHRGKSSAVPANVSTTLVIVILTRVGDMREHLLIKFICEGVHRIAVELDITLLVYSLKSELIEIARPTEFLVLKLVTHLVEAED
jgi:hypothetical protein